MSQLYSRTLAGINKTKLRQSSQCDVVPERDLCDRVRKVSSDLEERKRPSFMLGAEDGEFDHEDKMVQTDPPFVVHR